MMRDPKKDQAYWQEYLRSNDQWIQPFLRQLEAKEGDLEVPYTFLKEFSLRRLYGLYSAGAPLDELRPVFETLTEMMGLTQEADYEDVRQFLALAVLLEMPVTAQLCQQLIQRLDAFYVRMESRPLPHYHQDLWLTVLQNHLLDTHIPLADKTYFFPAHQRFYDLLRSTQNCTDQEAVALISTHLKTWYAGQKHMHWYGTHTMTGYVYDGYWSMECAALAKMLNLPASAFDGVHFFPTDFFA